MSFPHAGDDGGEGGGASSTQEHERARESSVSEFGQRRLMLYIGGKMACQCHHAV